ncbi:extensin-like domain-containing protein [Ancylobacter moscoviensis]
MKGGALPAAILALLLTGGPLAAQSTRELKQSIDQAGNAINRQLGEWIGVAQEPPPERPARPSAPRTKPKTARATAPASMPASAPLPPRRPFEADQQAALEPDETPAGNDAAPEMPEAAPAPPPSPRPAPPPAGRAAKPAPEVAPTGTTEEPAEAPAKGRATAPVPLPPPGPNRQLAALPPPEPAVTTGAAPEPPADDDGSQGAQPAPTICPELSNENLGVFTPVSVAANNAACTVDRGVSLSAVRMKDGRMVTLEPPAVLRCAMAAAVARWLREGVDPAIATLGAPLGTVLVAASQQCRPRNRVPGAKISEHGRGNAIDTRGYVLADGRRFVIGTPAKGSAERAMPLAFQERLKASACADFTTILGPGSDGYHELHLHVDRAERRNDLVLCRWATAEIRAGGAAARPAPKPSSKPDAKPAAQPAEDAPDDEETSQ